MRILSTLSTLLGLCWLTACSPSLSSERGGLRHAQLLHMEEQGNTTLVRIANPWDSTANLASYALLPREAPTTDSLALSNQGYQVLRVPLRRCLPLSAVHASLATDLGATSTLAGICDKEWVVSPKVQALRLTNFGSSMQPNVELILQQNIEAVFISPYEGLSLGALTDLPIPLIQCADYLEHSPLGRAEWMRFYGRLWGQGQRADSLFQAEEKAYQTLAQQARKEVKHRPTLLVDGCEGKSWYVPAGNSYLAQLYADAGARYLFASLPGTGSTALDVERVLSEAKNAEVWVIKYARVPPLTLTRQRLLEDHAIYGHFRAFSKGRMYGCNTLAVPYYEELPFHPSRLLREWLALIHPGLLPEQQNKYFLPLP